MIDKTEKILLGTILAIPEYQEQVISEMDSNLFTTHVNKLVYNCIKNLYTKGHKIDLLTVVNAFSKTELEEIGGAYYIASLTSEVASGYNYDEHIRILKENYIRTHLITLFNEEIVKLSDRSNDIQETNIKVTTTLEDLFNIASGDTTHIYEVVKKRLETYESVEPGKLLGKNTGHSKLNKITNGWQSGDLIILAARPSMGKTAISLLFAKNAALEGEKVLYFSLEMQKERLVDRAISLETNINSNNLQAGNLESYQWDSLLNKSGNFAKIPIIINDDSGLTVEQIRASSLKELSKGKIGLIIVDYLQLINHSGGGNSTNDKVGHISKNLKGLAKKCDCPVIALAQLSRAVEQRSGDKRPILSDLRDSGNIEQDADVVMFLHRPEYYGIHEDYEGQSVINLIDVIIAKNRNGALGSTSFYKNTEWSYIGELPFEELNSLSSSMPFDYTEGIEPNF